MRAVTLLAAMILLAACGQTGALYLPDAEVESPVEIRAPGAPAPPAEPNEEKKDKSGPPPGR